MDDNDENESTTMQNPKSLRSLFIAAAMLSAIGGVASNLHAASNAPEWRRVTIPGVSSNSVTHSVWARTPYEAYAWVGRDLGQSLAVSLYRYDGTSWTTVLQTNGNRQAFNATVHGTGANEVFAAFDRYVWRSGDHGLTWQIQSNVSIPVGFAVRQIVGTPNDIHVLLYGGIHGQILRFNGTAWSKVYDSAGIFDPAGYRPYALTFAGPNEGYWLSCWGRGRWNGTSWVTQANGFDFCDIYGTFAKREANGAFGWWAVGNNNFGNGIRVWCFNTNSMSFGGKSQYCFSDGSGSGVGSAVGIWGSSLNDVYVIGSLTTGSPAGLPGRLYHSDGANWSRVAAVGNIPECISVSGSARDDVWVALGDGTLLHYAPPVPPACLDISTCSALTIKGLVGATYRVESAANVLGPWQSVTNLTLPQSPYLWLDPSSVGQPKRFYRAVSNP